VNGAKDYEEMIINLIEKLDQILATIH